MSLMKAYNRIDLNFVKGKGVYLYDKEGNKYLDFVAGIAVNCLGHSNEIMINAIKNQSEKLIHISNLYYDDNQNNLAKKLIDLSDHNSVFFCNSGSEAVEGALKVARKFGKKYNKDKILYFKKSFHGRTMGSLSVTGNEKYQKSFKPLIGGVEEVIFNDKDDFIDKFDDKVCAVIIEPIQGEGGINEVDSEFLELISNYTSKNDALLIFDEVQCGAGRTGKFFAYKNYNVIPDIITMAKGLGGGLPIGAFIVNKKADVLTYGDHGCTFGGNPLVTAVSNKIIEEISKKEFLDNVVKKGEYIKEKIEEVKNNCKIIGKIKGKGLLLGIDIKKDVGEFINLAMKENLLVINAGKETIRLIPPLNISFEEIDEFIEKFEKIIKVYD